MALIEYMRRRSRLLFAGTTWQFAVESGAATQRCVGARPRRENALASLSRRTCPAAVWQASPEPVCEVPNEVTLDGVYNIALRLLLCLPLLLFFVPFMPVEALGKGGTNMHELANTRATVPTYQSPSPSDGFVSCGRGRYRDPRRHKCRGPADFGN
jgi:hypothetical protein